MGKGIRAALAAATLAVGLMAAGCGSSSHSSPSGQATINGDPVMRAADVTSRVPGYRLAAIMQVTTPVGPQTIQMSGTYDRPLRAGEMTSSETINGRHLSFTEVFSGLTFYLRAAGVPGLSTLSGGKQWLKFDMSRMLGAMGLGSLPTGTDPSQFLDYLRAVSSSTKRLGTATVRGVSTTRYHAAIDLSRYPKLVPPSGRSAARRAIATLESALGSHTMPVDAWVDGKDLVRRIQLAFSECVENQHMKMNMTMDLFDYGPQKVAKTPSTSQVDDITPLLSASLNKLHLGCTASG